MLTTKTIKTFFNGENPLNKKRKRNDNGQDNGEEGQQHQNNKKLNIGFNIGEKSFWKIWRNLYLRNIIFRVLDKPLVFKNRDELYLGNRMKFENLVSIDIMISKNALNLLSDKIESHYPLDITSLSISKLYQSNKYLNILERLYINYKLQMDDIRVCLVGAPIESLKMYYKWHTNNGGVIGIINYNSIGGVIDIISDKEIVDNAIISMNFQVLDFVQFIHNQVDSYINSSTTTTSSSSLLSSKIKKPIPSTGYNEELLIQNACKSNDPEKMLKYIEQELEVNLEMLIKKYPQINHYNILMNVLDKLSSERIPLVYYSANEGCSYDKPFHYVFPFKYDVDNLKCLVLDTVPKKNELLNRRLTIEELLEKYKSGYEHKYFPFFIDYFFKQNQVDRIIHYLKFSRTISIIGDQYKTLYNDMQIFFYVETIRHFNLMALEYVIESNISLHFLNKESVIEPLSIIVPTDQVIQFLKRFTSLYDVHCYIVKLLFIYYPIETIESLLENVQDFKIKFQKEINSERNETFCFLLTRVSMEKINLLLKFRTKKIEDIKTRKSNTITSKSNQDKINIFNQICNNDINQILTNQCKRKFFNDLNLSSMTFNETIQLYQSINFKSISHLEKFRIQSFLFRSFILNIYESNDYFSMDLLILTLNNNNLNSNNNNNNNSNISTTTSSSLPNSPPLGCCSSSKKSILEKIVLLNNHYILKKFTKSLINNDYSNEIIIYLVLQIIKFQLKLPFSIVYSLLDQTRYQVMNYFFKEYKELILYSCKNRIGLTLDPDNGTIDQLFINFKYQYYYSAEKMVTSFDTFEKCQALFLHFGSPNYLVEYLKSTHKEGSPLIQLDQAIINRIFEYSNLDQFLEISKHLSFKNQSNQNSTTTTTTTTTTPTTAVTTTTTTTNVMVNNIENQNNNNIDNHNNNYNQQFNNNNEQLNEIFENVEVIIGENEGDIMETESLDSNNGITYSNIGDINDDGEFETIAILNNSITFNRLDIISHLLSSDLLSPFTIMNYLISKDKLFMIENIIINFKSKYFSNPIDKKLNLVHLSILNASTIGSFRLIESLYPEYNNKFIIGRSIINLLVQKDRNNDKLIYLHRKGHLCNLDYLNHKVKRVNGTLTKLVFPPEISKTITSIIQSQSIKKEPDNLDKKKLKKRSKY
ncbi:hypothetical protein DDB_G0282059 [Dictyostelium discoideum AX4]|uniref:Uncharacterized protein n=1 Tax=Dictyostelium discoideum TaxID=44689 RepID=Q54T10_DICDI|nr:hypothetical protein DDB_G0282059 [Dictyostelium discoideum AX4]EAL66451.1 hypothetical protein DDB_G0282059 [Dictyostelium discoideum AX4]|eukprot:XP_640441.1 hypothetical protein DDB_G0282059 [Dictyostelium discoideum AX4]